MSDASSDRDEASLYRVLARKYRPSSFADLVGQEALVRTLTNAIETGRLAHAFVLTGVRGVGKTTTARIIARALNCVGPDGSGGPTPAPCGVCEHCLAIAQDRHVDVIEMDAASRTGVADIRELIEGVRYRPVQARYKIYIIDEVHMLSTSAFNALLKTLEEPPEHVVFIFATTEIRKVPVTVLSRCQRFDLRRLAQEELAALFTRIAEQEDVAVEAEALAMIARAADGSARDGLSLLDQAMALGGGKTVSGDQVQAMLGLADRARIFDLLTAVVTGKVPESLEILAGLHAAGADPAVVIQDLLELSHFLTRAKLVPATLDAPGQPETERVRGRELSEKLSMASLARIWQMLLKSLGEVQSAPIPLQAAEMALIRLAYASDLPSPADLVQRLTGGAEAAAGNAGAGHAGTASAPKSAHAPSPEPAAGPLDAGPEASAALPPRDQPAPMTDGSPQAALAQPLEETFDLLPEADPQPSSGTDDTAPKSFAEAVALVRGARETMLANHLMDDVHLVRFEPGRIEITVREEAPPNLASRFAAVLEEVCGSRWIISISQEPGAPTLREQERAAEAEKRAAVMDHPLVKAAMETFPDAELVARRDGAGRSGGGEPSPRENERREEEGEQDA